MSILVSTLLAEIDDMVQEDAAFSSGLWSASELIGYINDIQKEFVLKSQILKDIDMVNAVAAQRIYDDPDDSMQIDRIAFGNIPLYRSSRTVLDKDDPDWRGKAGRPRQYHQDQLSTKKFESDRAPESGMVGMGYAATGNYGPLREMSGSVTYTATIPAVGRGGILRQMWGVRPYVAILPAPGRGGFLRRVVSGASNFEVIFTRLIADVAAVTDVLTVPDFTKPYIKFGVLSKMLSKEGEGQDLLRARYCRRRMATGINLLRRLMGAAPLTEDE